MVWMVLPGAIMFQIKPETRGEPLLFTISAPGSFTGHFSHARFVTGILLIFAQQKVGFIKLGPGLV